VGGTDQGSAAKQKYIRCMIHDFGQAISFGSMVCSQGTEIPDNKFFLVESVDIVAKKFIPRAKTNMTT